MRSYDRFTEGVNFWVFLDPLTIWTAIQRRKRSGWPGIDFRTHPAMLYRLALSNTRSKICYNFACCASYKVFTIIGIWFYVVGYLVFYLGRNVLKKLMWFYDFLFPKLSLITCWVAVPFHPVLRLWCCLILKQFSVMGLSNSSLLHRPHIYHQLDLTFNIIQ